MLGSSASRGLDSPTNSAALVVSHFALPVLLAAPQECGSAGAQRAVAAQQDFHSTTGTGAVEELAERCTAATQLIAGPMHQELAVRLFH